MILATALAAGLFHDVDAAQVYWSVEPIAADGSSVRNGGTRFLGLNLSGATTLVNGVQFEGQAGATFSQSANGVTVTVAATTANTDFPGAPLATEPGLSNVLDSGVTSADVTDESSWIDVTLTGLVTGVYYRVQFFCHEPGAAAGTVDLFARNHTNTANESAVISADGTAMQSIVALFWADSSTQNLRLYPNDNDVGADRAVLNGITVYETPASPNRRVTLFPNATADETLLTSYAWPVSSNTLLYTSRLSTNSTSVRVRRAGVYDNTVTQLFNAANEFDFYVASNLQRVTAYDTSGYLGPSGLYSLSPTGGPAVRLNTNASGGAVSWQRILPNNTVAMYQDNSGLYRVPVSGGSLTAVTPPYLTQFVTPDSARFVWVNDNHFWNPGVWSGVFSLPTTGGSTSVLHNGVNSRSQFIWPVLLSPNSQKAVYSAYSNGWGRLYSANVTGGGEVLLSEPGHNIGGNEFTISPDSSRVLMMRGGTTQRLYSVPIGGGAASILEWTYVGPDAVYLAPNGTRLIYSSYGSNRVVLCDLTGGNRVTLFSDPSVGENAVAFTPDSSRAVFNTRVGFSTQRLISVSIPSGATSTLLNVPDGALGAPVISPNGQFVAVRVRTPDATNGGWRSDIVSIAVTGGPVTRLTPPGSNNVAFASDMKYAGLFWTPDSRRVLYEGNDPIDQRRAYFTDVPETVEPFADIAVRITTTQSAAVVTYPFTYVLTVTNHGPNASLVTVTNRLPAGVQFQSAVASTGTFSHSGGIITFQPGWMRAGRRATLSVDVMTTAAGVLTNEAVAHHVANDPVATNQRAVHVLSAGVPQADLSLSKTENKDPTPVGHAFLYRIAVTNEGPHRATNVVIRDVLPTNMTFVTATINVGTWGHQAGVVTGVVNLMNVGDVVQFNITANPSSLGSYTNLVRVDSPTVDPNTNNNVAAAVTRVRGATPDVIVGKSLLSGPAFYGDLMTYQVVVSNDGPFTATGVVVTDSLPASVQFYAATTTVGTCVFTGGQAVCTIGNLASAAVARVTISGFAVGTGILTNLAAGGSTTVDSWPENDLAADVSLVSCLDCRAGDSFDTGLDSNQWMAVSGGALTTSTQMARGRGLYFSLAGNREAVLRPMTVTTSDTVRYQFRLGDGSPGWDTPESGDGVALEYSTNGTTFTQLLLPPTTVRAWSNLSVAVPPAAAGTGTVFRWRQLANSGAGQDAWALDQVCVGAAATSIADLTLAGQVAPGVAATGDELVFTWTVSNRGSAAASVVRAELTYPRQVLPIGATVATGDVRILSDRALWSIASLAPGASATITVSAVGLDAGTWTNGGYVTSLGCDASEADNSLALPVTLTGAPRPELVVSKTIASVTNVSGETVLFSIAVTNAGFAGASDVVLTDVLPVSLSYLSASSTVGSCAAGGGSVTCSVGSVAANTSLVVTLWTTAGALGPVTNTAIVSSSSAEGTLMNNTARVEGVTVCRTCLLADDFESGFITSRWASLSGGSVTSGAGLATGFAVKMTNSGTRSLTSVSLDATLLTQVRFSYRAGDSTAGWNASESSDIVQVQYSATGGAFQVLTAFTNSLYTQWTNITLALPADARSPATVFRFIQINSSSANTDEWALDTVCFAAFLERQADLGISATVPAGEASTGVPLLFTVAVSNNGPQAAQDTRITATLPGSMLIRSVSAPGGFAWVGPSVDAYVGTVAAASSTSVVFEAFPLQAGSWTGLFRVAHSSCDEVATNDAASVSAVVTGVTIVAGPGYLTFGTDTIDTPENKPVVGVTVLRTNGSQVAVAVTYTSVQATAVAPGDFGPATGTLFFAVGETSKTVFVGIVDDQILEGEESFSLRLESPAGGASIGGRSNVLIRIQDNDVPGALALGATNYSVSEAAGQVVVRIDRSLGAVGVVTVLCETVAGSATAPSDFTAVTSNVVFDAGVFSRSVAIAIAQDSAPESVEAFDVRIRSASGGATFGSATSAVVSIIDDDQTIQFSAATQPVSEGAGSAVVVVTRLGDATITSTVNYATANGTAVAGADYAATSGTLTFTNGQTTASFPVTILNDSTIGEPDETVLLTLSAPSANTSLGSLKTSQLVIQDNDRVALREDFEQGQPADWIVRANQAPSAKWRFDDPGARGNRTGGGGRFATADSDFFGTVRMGTELITPAMNFAGVNSVFLSYAYDFRAYSGRWWNAPSGYGIELCDVDVSVNGQGGPWVNVWQIGDPVSVYGPATANLDVSSHLAGAPNAAIRFRYRSAYYDYWWQVDAVRVSAVSTEPAGPGRLRLAASSYSVRENDGTLPVTIQRVGGAQGSVSVTLQAVAGTASSGPDFVLAPTVVTFPNLITSVTVPVPVVDDTTAENAETFSLQLVSPQGGATLSTPASAAVTILDDDGLVSDVGVSISATASPWRVNEPVALRVSVSNNGPQAASRVLVQQEFAPTTLLVTTSPSQGSVSNTAAGIEWHVGALAPFAEAMLVLTSRFPLLGEVTNRAWVSTDDADTVPENDEAVLTAAVRSPGRLQFSSGGYSVSESGGAVTIEVQRIEDSLGDVSVSFTAQGLSATAGADFIATNGVLSFADGVVASTFRVEPINDGIIEGQEFVRLLLSAPVGASLGAGEAFVAIEDDDIQSLLLSQGFGSGSGPARLSGSATNWTVVTNAGPAGWRFDNPGARTNQTGGLGGMAIADSAFAGNVAMDTELRSPAVNLANVGAAILSFRTDLQSTQAFAEVAFSTNSAGSWETLWAARSPTVPGPQVIAIDLSGTALGSTNACFRFRYFNATNDGWWQIDDFRIYGEEDTDADGLPDWWEALNFQGLGQAAGGDFDEDGTPNGIEWEADTSPTNKNSNPEIHGFAFTNGQPVLRFDGSPVRLYDIEGIPALNATGWTTLDTSIPGSGGSQATTVPNADSNRIFRLRIRPF